MAILGFEYRRLVRRFAISVRPVDLFVGVDERQLPGEYTNVRPGLFELSVNGEVRNYLTLFRLRGSLIFLCLDGVEFRVKDSGLLCRSVLCRRRGPTFRRFSEPDFNVHLPAHPNREEPKELQHLKEWNERLRHRPCPILNVDLDKGKDYVVANEADHRRTCYPGACVVMCLYRILGDRRSVT